MSYTVIIGLEVHVQLQTRTKIFCRCSTAFAPDRPNTQTCPVCLGMPGALPVMNREAFRLALKTALALDGPIARVTKWDRKQYFYPDLPKGYQISQYDLPFCSGGALTIRNEHGEPRTVRLNRIHLEEDAGKNLHDESGRGDSRVDLNRAGTPLLEIVTQPDIRSPFEARRFLEELRLLLWYLGVSDCNMQEGSLRCDANINLHVDESGQTVATPIVEVKNLNSFRNVEAALQYEVRRQWKQWQEHRVRLEDAEKETRGFDAERSVTFPQRGKEEASDYRYFPDPDLVPVTVTDDELQAIRARMCEFPAARRDRFQTVLGLSEYDAAVIIDQGRAFADYFESVAKGCGDGKLAANWITQDVLRVLNERGWDIEHFPLSSDVMTALLQHVARRDITTKSGREVFSALLEMVDRGESVSPDSVAHIIEQRGLRVVTDTAALEAAINEVIQANERIANDVRGGKVQALGPLIGQVMKRVKGADARQVRQMLLQKLQPH